MGLSLTVLGCSGTYAGPGNACSGYLVRSGDTSVWLDCGPGTLANLQHHVGLAELDGLVISHSHPDHWLELPVFVNALKYALGRRGFPVWGTAETWAKLAATTDGLAGTVLDWHDISDGDSTEVEGLELDFSRTDHPVETLAVRVTDSVAGRSLAYSADTAAGWSFEAFGGPPVDLAVCEATMRNDQEGEAPHLSGGQAGAIARAAGAGRLVITHLWPTNDPALHRSEAEAAFGAPVEVAEPHRVFDA